MPPGTRKKYRRKIFNDGIFAYFETKLKEIRKHYPLIGYKTVNHDKDHAHFLISIPPTVNVGSTVRIIKSNTARLLKRKFPLLNDLHCGTDGIWSDGYFAITVGIDEQMVHQYIE